MILEKTVSRRMLLALGTGTALTLATGTALADSNELQQLEREHQARLGVFAKDAATGHAITYRADERFPMCSTFKTIVAANVLRDKPQSFLDRLIRYAEADVRKAGGGFATSKPENIANGMTVKALCEAAIVYSDNTAANLLLAELGGPTSVTRFSSSIGDLTTRLDRLEPELNSAEPDRITDTTTPRAIAFTYGRLTLGRALDQEDRDRLVSWLKANTTSAARFRKGLPPDWVLGDKTGTGSYGTANDVGITWPPGRGPIVISVFTTQSDQAATPDNELVARAAQIVAAKFS